MNKPRKLVDIVIPFNNEALNLKILLPKLLKVLKKIKFLRFRLIFIDDGSDDKGSDIINKFKNKHKFIYILKHKNKLGQTQSYKSYFKKYKSEYFIRMDADNQDDPVNILKLVEPIKRRYGLILTERKLRKHSIYMVVLTFLYNKLISLLAKKKLSNYSSSLACFNRKYIPYKNLKNNDHRYLPIIAIDNGVQKIKIFSVLHKKRIYGMTKYGMIKKLFFALPEFIIFFYRLKLGYFKK